MTGAAWVALATAATAFLTAAAGWLRERTAHQATASTLTAVLRSHMPSNNGAPPAA